MLGERRDCLQLQTFWPLLLADSQVPPAERYREFELHLPNRPLPSITLLCSAAALPTVLECRLFRCWNCRRQTILGSKPPALCPAITRIIFFNRPPFPPSGLRNSSRRPICSLPHSLSFADFGSSSLLAAEGSVLPTLHLNQPKLNGSTRPTPCIPSFFSSHLPYRQTVAGARCQ